jgi:hypothetical protein
MPHLSSDIIVERHILDVLGLTEPWLAAGSVWLGHSVVLRTDERQAALEIASQLAATVRLPLWRCEGGESYRRLAE